MGGLFDEYAYLGCRRYPSPMEQGIPKGVREGNRSQVWDSNI